MNDGARHRSVRTSAQRLRTLAIDLATPNPDDHMTPLDRIRDAQGHLKAASYDGANVTTTGISDPTGNAPPNQANVDLRRLDLALTNIETQLQQLERIVDAYRPPRHANELDQLALARLNMTPVAGCENCARILGANSQARWEPADSRCPEPTTANGRLDQPIVMCSWCRNRLDLWGRLPSERELERHHRGERVPWPADVPKP